MRRRIVAAAIVVCGLPGGAAAPNPPAESPAVSIERIQEALGKPPLLIFTDRRPDFSVSISDSLRYDNPFGRVEKKRRPSDWEAFFTGDGTRIAGAIGLAAATASLAGDGTMSARPLIAMNLLAVGTVVADKVGTALHNRKVRKTREQVRRELEEFCALNGCTPPPLPNP